MTPATHVFSAIFWEPHTLTYNHQNQANDTTKATKKKTKTGRILSIVITGCLTGVRKLAYYNPYITVLGSICSIIPYP